MNRVAKDKLEGFVLSRIKERNRTDSREVLDINRLGSGGRIRSYDLLVVDP